MGQEVAAAQAAQQRAMVEASGADGALSLMVEVMQQASRRAAAAPPGMLRDIHNAAADFVSKLTVLARQSATESHDRADAAHAAVLRAQAAAEEAQRIEAAATVESDADAEARRAAAAEAASAAAVAEAAMRRSAAAEVEARRAAAAEAEARRAAAAEAEQTRPFQMPALFSAAAVGAYTATGAARVPPEPAPRPGDAANGETPSPPAADARGAEPAAHIGDDSNLFSSRRVSASSPAAGDSSALDFLAQAAGMQDAQAAAAHMFAANRGGIFTRSQTRVSAQDEARAPLG
jgi:hypothetical protein